MPVWLSLLTCIAALYESPRLRLKQLADVRDWKAEVSGLDAAGLKEHLLGWVRLCPKDSRFGGNLTKYEDLVEQLKTQGFSGEAFLFLREAVLGGGNILFLPGVSNVPAPLHLEFLYMLKELPQERRCWQETGAEGFVWEPPWPFSVGVALITIYTICLLISFFGTLFYWYPANLDKDKPENRRKRQKNVVRILGFLMLTVWSMFFALPGEMALSGMITTYLFTTFGVLVVLNLVVVIEVSEDVSKDLLEFSAPERMKDALRNNWTNTALLAALNFTIVVSYGFPFDAGAELMEFPGSLQIVNFLGQEFAWMVSLVYYFCVSLSVTEYVVSMISATLHLMFTEPLSTEDADQYYKDNSRAPAEPLMWFLCAAFWHIIATAILFQASFGQGWSFLLWMLGGALWIAKVWHESSVWAPKQKVATFESIEPRPEDDIRKS